MIPVEHLTNRWIVFCNYSRVLKVGGKMKIANHPSVIGCLLPISKWNLKHVLGRLLDLVAGLVRFKEGRAVFKRVGRSNPNSLPSSALPRQRRFARVRRSVLRTTVPFVLSPLGRWLVISSIFRLEKKIPLGEWYFGGWFAGKNFAIGFYGIGFWIHFDLRCRVIEYEILF